MDTRIDLCLSSFWLLIGLLSATWSIRLRRCAHVFSPSSKLELDTAGSLVAVNLVNDLHSRLHLRLAILVVDRLATEANPRWTGGILLVFNQHAWVFYRNDLVVLWIEQSFLQWTHYSSCLGVNCRQLFFRLTQIVNCFKRKRLDSSVFKEALRVLVLTRATGFAQVCNALLFVRPCYVTLWNVRFLPEYCSIDETSFGQGLLVDNKTACWRQRRLRAHC